ncbi:MAG: hypothetical protein Q9213_000728 [Squamulea squamosa]
MSTPLPRRPASKPNSKTDNIRQPSCTQNLPFEILTEIFILVKSEWRMPQDMYALNRPQVSIGDGHPSKDPNLFNRNKRFASYKSFRGVCRLWYDVATPLLFETVVLLPNINSWRRLHMLCETQHLARHIHAIHVVTSRPKLKGDETIKEWREAREPLPKIQSYATTPNGIPLARMSYDDKSAWRRYGALYKEEKLKATKLAYETAPKVALNLLSNLQQIRTVDDWELQNARRRYVFRCDSKQKAGDWESFRTVTVREIMMKVPDLDGIRSDIDTGHFDLFLRALHDSGAAVPSLTLGSGLMLFDNRCPYSIRSLRRLELDLSYWEEPKWYQAGDKRRIQLPPQFSDWLYELYELEDLSIIDTRSYLNHTDFLLYLASLKLPGLCNVYLERICTTYYSLNTFLEAHRHTIRKFHIESPRVSAEDWRKFCNQEKESTWKDQGKQLLLSHGWRLFGVVAAIE